LAIVVEGLKSFDEAIDVGKDKVSANRDDSYIFRVWIIRVKQANIISSYFVELGKRRLRVRKGTGDRQRGRHRLGS
jgi:hypothetical protein